MPLLFAFVLLVLAQGVTQAAPDEIDQWMKGFDPMSENGLWPSIDLPGDAPLEKVVEAFVKTERKTTESDQFEGYQIVESKKIVQPGSVLTGYTVVLIRSVRGSKTILLLKNPDAREGGWWARPYFITTVP